VTPTEAAVVDARLAALDVHACRAFVADLWAARGFETTVDDSVVVATRRGTTVVLFPASGSRLRRPASPSRPVDVVVAPAGGDRAAALAADHDARLLTAADLGEMLRYAVDPTTAETLCERHLGAPPSALRPPFRTRTRRRIARLRAVASPVGSTTVLVVLALVVATAGFVALDTAERPAGDRSASAGATGAADGSSAVTEAGGATETPQATTERDVAVGRTRMVDARALSTVPGINGTGITNVTALALAHDRALGNRSYTIWADTYRPKDGIPGAERVQHDTDFAVAGDRYLVVESIESTDGRRLVRAVYYDGTDWYIDDRSTDERMLRWVDGTTAGAAVDPDPRSLRTALVTYYLATERSNVTGHVETGRTTRYRIEGSGAPPSLAVQEVYNYDFVAVVDSDGLVREAVVEYTVVNVEGSYQFRFEWSYDRLNATTVSEPAWIERARPPATSTPAANRSATATPAPGAGNATTSTPA
jgi:hypothetical protein